VHAVILPSTSKLPSAPHTARIRHTMVQFKGYKIRIMLFPAHINADESRLKLPLCPNATLRRCKGDVEGSSMYPRSRHYKEVNCRLYDWVRSPWYLLNRLRGPLNRFGRGASFRQMTETESYVSYRWSNRLTMVNTIIFFYFFLNRPLLPCGVEGFLLVNL
jgi:hypothetical protein